jgi:hypothetical protein
MRAQPAPPRPEGLDMINTASLLTIFLVLLGHVAVNPALPLAVKPWPEEMLP